MSLMQGGILERKVDGHAWGPSIFEHWIFAQKKSLNKFSDDGSTPYKSSEIFTKLEIVIYSQLIYSLFAQDRAIHNIYYLDENDLVSSQSVLEV